MLAGCADEAGLDELQRFVESTLAQGQGAIEALPEFHAYVPFTYSAAKLRSPFEPPLMLDAPAEASPARQRRPDEQRPKEYLEDFSIAQLSMVGSLGRDGRQWALIRDGKGDVHRVGQGKYLGRNHGRVVAVTAGRLELVEIVPNGRDGWSERAQVLLLQGLEGESPGSPIRLPSRPAKREPSRD